MGMSSLNDDADSLALHVQSESKSKVSDDERIKNILKQPADPTYANKLLSYEFSSDISELFDDEKYIDDAMAKR